MTSRHRGRRFRFARSVLRHPQALLGTGFLAVIFALVIYGEYLDPIPERAFPCLGLCSNLPPFVDSAHLLGTYPTGQDVLSETAHGAASDLLIGFGATAIAMAIGIVVGAAAGYASGAKGALMLGITQLFLTIPSFAIVVWFYRSYGSSNLFSVPLNVVYLMLILGAFAWPPVAMVVRSEVIRTKEEEFVLGARALGSGTARLVFKHLIPNIMTPLAGVVALIFAANITAEAIFTYLGLVNPVSDVVTWGFLIWEGQKYLVGDWWVSFFPGLMLVLTTVGVTLVGDVISDELNPKLR